MAGISLSLDKYYTANYANETTTIENEQISSAAVSTQEAVEAATGAAVDTSVTATESAVAKEAAAKDSKKKKKTPKKEKVSKRYQSLGISIAGDYVNIRKHASTDSKVMGKLYEGSAAKILARKGEWVKIASGDVKGYINKDFLAIGADAQKLADRYGKKHASVKPGVVTLNVRMKNDMDSSILTQIPEDEKYDVLNETDHWVKISIDDGANGYVSQDYVNISVSYKKAVSIQEERAQLARKRAARRAERERLEELARERAQKAETKSAPAKKESSSSAGSKSSASSSGTGSTRSKAASKASGNSSSAKAKSSSGNSSAKTGSSTAAKSSSTRSESSSQAGKSSSSSKSSASQSSYSGSGTGAEIASYAQKFVGNPYVYGGTSLTNGTDCSGFTMSIYAQFGYSIPRTSGAQSGYGTAVSLSNVKAGDLIFYKNGSSVGHVALYIGGGQVVHASNPSDGIKISGMYYRKPCSARRIVG